MENQNIKSEINFDTSKLYDVVFSFVIVDIFLAMNNYKLNIDSACFTVF